MPDEDTGVLFATVSLEPGMSQNETQQVTDRIDKMLASNPYVESRVQLVGYNFIAGQGSNQATFIVKLKPFEDRKYGLFDRISSVFNGAGIAGLFIDPTSSNMILGMIYKQTASIKGAQVLAFAPPMVPGFAMSNGLNLSMQGKTGGDLNKFFQITQDYLKALKERPEISNAMTSYNPNYPQYMVDVDVAKTKKAGTSPAAVLSVIQGYYGGMYASNFNAYGKLFRVMIQGTVESRINERGLNSIYVRTPSGMAPVSEFCTLRRVSAQYESYILPLAVVLSIPFGLAGAFIFTQLFGHNNDIYMQISLIMLIGLLAKNAILIVEFALERRRTGMAIKYAAILGAGARLRPILMTSLAMIVGLLPLMFASGVGHNGNQTLGAAAVGGMLIGTLCQVFVVPALFVIFEYLQEKFKPMVFADEDYQEVAKELEQYVNGPAGDYKLEQ